MWQPIADRLTQTKSKYMYEEYGRNAGRNEKKEKKRRKKRKKTSLAKSHQPCKLLNGAIPA